MKYVGSKNRLSKELVPIIQNFITNGTESYIEPFVGGANMIDKIECKNKKGYDIHAELIELLKHTRDYQGKDFPKTISEEEYKLVKNNKNDYDKWYVGLVGFSCGFGAKYFGGFARGVKSDKITLRDMPNEAMRNLQKQASNLIDINFKCQSFLDIDIKNIENSVIYCDIPYRDTLKYKTELFPYDDFYKWCVELSKNNTVLVSEYNMPEEFKCIWSKESKVGMNQGLHKKRIEKLFQVRN